MKLAGDGDPGVRFQVALAVADVGDDDRAAAALARIAVAAQEDRWARAAVVSAAGRRALAVFERVPDRPENRGVRGELAVLVAAVGDAEGVGRVIRSIVPEQADDAGAPVMSLAGDVWDALGRRGMTDDALPRDARERLQMLTDRARVLLKQPRGSAKDR